MRRAVFSWVVIAVGVGVIAPNMGGESLAQAYLKSLKDPESTD